MGTEFLTDIPIRRPVNRDSGFTAFFIGLAVAVTLLPWGNKLAQATCPPDQSVVINEAFMTPQSGDWQYVEILNRGSATVDLTNWWICYQPAAMYIRLLQTPQKIPGSPNSPGIILEPGDFFVLRWGPSPSGNYSTRPNSAGTTTHMADVFIPEMGSGRFNPSGGNLTLFLPGTPDDPDFSFASGVRDHCSWGLDGIYTGTNRGCVSIDACLWQPPVAGECYVVSEEPQIPSVNSNSLTPMTNTGISYKGTPNNSAEDYYIGPITPGEPNTLPGDLDADFDVDMDDYNLFMSCYGQAPQSPPCLRADMDGSHLVSCGDWQLFLSAWHANTTLPDPPAPTNCVGNCMLGDLNNDGFVTWDDNVFFFGVLVGQDTDPIHVCAADVFHDGVFNCNDIMAFFVLLQGQPLVCVRGDVNGDGLIDGDDIQPFVEAVTGAPCLSPVDFCRLDVNSDFQVNDNDVQVFVDLLISQAN